MEVILKDDVVNLGHRGDLVKVADGYARNFLLPRKLALQATVANKAVVEQMKNAAARRSATEKALAEALAVKLEPSCSTSPASRARPATVGSVTSADIAAGLNEGLRDRPPQDSVGRADQELGEFTVTIKLYREVRRK